MELICAGENFPTHVSVGTLFLAGALPRAGKAHQEPAEWRADFAYGYLEAHFRGTVLTPQRRDGSQTDYVDQIAWEQWALQIADVLLIYLTRTEEVLALSTNTETGKILHFGPTRVVVCIPDDPALALKTDYQQALAQLEGITPIVGLEAGLAHAIALIGEGAERFGGECQVPLCVWRTPSFQAWYNSLKAAGHRLDGFRLDRLLCPVPEFVLFWVAKVSVWVEGEQRHKDNEWVISRPDVAHCVLVHRYAGRVHVVTVSEFRSTVRNSWGRVLEAPGGSSAKPGLDPVQVALDEVREETGLDLGADQVTFVASRQLAATTTTHHAYVMVAELTDEQFAWACANQGTLAGNRAETEQCVLTIAELGQLFEGDVVDWSQVGMATQAVLTLDAATKPHYTVSGHAGGKSVVVVLDALTPAALQTILGFMATGTAVVYASGQEVRGGFDRRADIARTLQLFAERLQQQGLEAQFVALAPTQLEAFLRSAPGAVTVFGFSGDYGLGMSGLAQLELARQLHVPVVSAWIGSTPQPELVPVYNSISVPDDGYVPFSRQWQPQHHQLQLCGPEEYAVISVGRITPAAYYQLAALMITGTHLIYGGAPIGQEAPYGRVHITRTLRTMAAKLSIAGIEARFTHLEEPDAEARRLQLLALAQKHRAPLLAFVDDQGLPMGVAQECEWAHASGLPVVGMWVGSSGGIEFRVDDDALDVNPASLAPLVHMRSPSLVLAARP